MSIRRLFIANRGEIAVRIIRAARELGITTIQGVSTADRSGLAAKMADEVIEIGPPQAARSYLDPQAIISAALAVKADAIHPGYGFLSESASFAGAVQAAGMVFVGPEPATIEAMGDKVNARKNARLASVPTVPGSEGRVTSVDAALTCAKEIGYPIMLKAAAGGGGRGIRIARHPDDLSRLFTQTAAEAQAAFGDGGLYLERFVEKAHHIEVQILGDGERVLHLFDRECSLQRRHQKVWEEAPAVCVDEAVRAQLCASAVRLASALRYRGVGTLEYLYDEETQEFFFIEMNTRLQVEHTVTEMLTGIDLVRASLRIAGGEPLMLQQTDIHRRGHAIEVRINAENVDKDFRPTPGLVARVQVPGGPGIRLDAMLFEGYQVPPYYDSLLGKLIVWDASRREALARLRRALDETEIEGVSTTLKLHRRLVDEEEVIAGNVHTRWLENWLQNTLGGKLEKGSPSH